MANSKYEYVKSFETEDEVFEPNIIVIRIQARNFIGFSDSHKVDKANDERAVDLMNSCATSILEEYPDIIFGYGFSDEYSFVLTRESKFYKRRASKILSLIVSFFTSVYVTRWKEYFPETELEFPPSFQSRVIVCASTGVLQAYLAWRQNECHVKNQYNTCFSLLVKCGKPEKEAEDILKGTKKQDKHEMLFQEFGMNYKKQIPDKFRQGSCVLKSKVEDIVKYNENSIPIRRLRKKVTVVHSANIAAKSFWNMHLLLVEEVGSFHEDINKVKPEYIKSFQFETKLMPSTWIVVRIDGCHFHKFSDVHEFEKPNDEKALNLMNSCAVAVLNEFQEVTFSYGVSDEYSFVLKKDSQLYQRHTSGIVSAIVSFFTSVYTMNWKTFFPHQKLSYSPCFDGRAVCYPSEQILIDYLAWRQVDCHINNQYNTCFWMLVKSGKSKREAQDHLKGTQTQQKNELLAKQFGIEYYELPVIFRQGSSVFWDMVQKGESVAHFDSSRKRKNEQEDETVASNDSCRKRLVVEHCNIIEQEFWTARPHILHDERLQCSPCLLIS